MKTSNNQYFKVYGDSQYGEGFAYYEFIGEICTRQIEEMSGELIAFVRDFSRPNSNLCDQPLSAIKFASGEKIPSHEFEKV